LVFSSIVNGYYTFWGGEVGWRDKLSDLPFYLPVMGSRYLRTEIFSNLCIGMVVSFSPGLLAKTLFSFHRQ
jgi:hypothetical protein